MSRIETLRRNYERVCGLPWDRNTAGAQRVWIASSARMFCNWARKTGSWWTHRETVSRATPASLAKEVESVAERRTCSLP